MSWKGSRRGSTTIVKGLKLAIVLGLFIVLAVYIRSSVDLEYLLQRARALRTGWPWLLLAQGLLLANLLLAFQRCRLLLAAQGIRYSPREAVSIGFIGYFFNQFFLGSTGGDLVRAWYVSADHPGKRAAGITTIFVDRVVGVLLLVAGAAAAIIPNWTRIASDPWLSGSAALVAGVLAGSAAGSWIIVSPAVEARIRPLLERLPLGSALGKALTALTTYRSQPGVVVSALLISVLVQATLVGAAICQAMAFGLRADPVALLFIVPLAHLATSIPLGTPGGLGQSEGAFTVLFGAFGLPRQDGLLLALAQRSNQYLWSLAGGVAYLLRKGRGPGWRGAPAGEERRPCAAGDLAEKDRGHAA